MHLCPFSAYTVAVVDATTRCLLMQRGVNRHGIAALERQFELDRLEYMSFLRDRSDAGRTRWVDYFASRLAAALRIAAKDVRDLRQHVVDEPWLEARPLTEREESAYQLVLRQGKATSQSILKDLGPKATSLRMVQRILVRLIDLGLVEKVGTRKDAYYRTVGLRRLESIDDNSFAASHSGGATQAAGPRRA